MDDDLPLRNDLSEIKNWLGNIFNTTKIPRFEINNVNVTRLSEIKKKYEENERISQLRLKDLDNKVNEYDADALHLEKILGNLGLYRHKLSSEAQHSLSQLGDLALLLKARNSTPTVLLLCLTELTEELTNLELQHYKLEKENLRLEKQLKSAFLKKMNLKLSLESSEQQAKLQMPVLKKKTQECSFLNQKSKEYKKNISSLKQSLKREDYNANIHHIVLQELAEEVSENEIKLKSMKERLDYFKQLPSNSQLAKVKIEEAKLELEKLNSEIERRLGAMQL